MTWVITIDGPAASGKSTVSRELAKRLACPWVSTGAFYRGLAFVALQLNFDLDDTVALEKLARSNEWSVALTSEKTRVYLGGEDVTEQISHEDVGNFASRISSKPLIRNALLEAQRNCSKLNQGLVAEGRDCGTVVFPQAQVKIYLTASSEHRAARRAQEQGAQTIDILSAQVVRDQQDSARKAAPMLIPDQALVLDTTHLSLQEVVNLVEKYAKEKLSL